MIHIQFPVKTRYLLGMSMQKEHAFRIPACAIFKSITLDTEPARMAMQIVNEDAGTPLYTLMGLACEKVDMAMHARNVTLLVESIQSLSHIDPMTIGEIDQMQVGEIPKNMTSL